MLSETASVQKTYDFVLRVFCKALPMLITPGYRILVPCDSFIQLLIAFVIGHQRRVLPESPGA